MDWSVSSWKKEGVMPPGAAIHTLATRGRHRHRVAWRVGRQLQQFGFFYSFWVLIGLSLSPFLPFSLPSSQRECSPYFGDTHF